MIIFCEILYVALLCAVTYTIVKSSTKVFVSGILLHSTSMLAAVSLLQISLFITKLLIDNVFTQWNICLSASIALYIFCRYKGRKHLNKKGYSFALFEKKVRVIKTLFIFCLGILFIVSSISITTILSSDEKISLMLKNKSLYCHLFITRSNPVVEANSWQELKSNVASHYGSNTLADNIRALNFILSIQTEEYDTLLSKNKNLSQLLKEPALQDIINDQHIISIFIDGDLSLREIYKLGANNKIKALLNNREFILLVRKIDLLQVEKNFIEYRNSLLQAISVQWSTSSINSSLQLDECIASGKWRQCTSDKILFKRAPFSLLKAHLSIPGRVTIICEADTAPILVQDDISLKMNSHGSSYSIELDNPQEVQLTLMFQFPKDSERCCFVKVLIESSNVE